MKNSLNSIHTSLIFTGMLCVGFFFSDSNILKADEEAELKPIQFEDPKLDHPVNFEDEILPILENNCIACHNMSNAESDLNLEELELMLKGGFRGPGLVPGKPDESLIFQVAARHEEPFMPPLPNEIEAKELTPLELGILRQWILEGAKVDGEGQMSQLAWQPLPAHLQAIYAVSMSPWGRYVAAGRSNRISIFDIGTQSEVAQLTDPNLAELQLEGNPFYQGNVAHRDFVQSLAYSPDGNTLASAGYRVIKLWKRVDQPLVSQFELPQDIVSITADPATRLAAVALADHSIALVQLSDGQVLKTLSGHTDRVNELVFLPENQLATVSADRTLRLWNTAEGTLLGQTEATAALTNLIAGADGSLYTGDAEGKVQVWTEGESGYQLKQEWPTHQGVIHDLALVAEGKSIASAGADGTIHIRQLADGAETAKLDQGAPVTSIYLRPDQQVLLAGSENGVIKFWQLSDGKMLGEAKDNLLEERAKIEAQQKQEIAQQLFVIAETSVTAADKNKTERDESLTKTKEELEKAKAAVPEAEKNKTAADEALAAAQAELEKDKENADLKKKVEEADKKAKEAVTAVEQAMKSLVSQERSAKLAEEAVTKAIERQQAATAHKATRETEKAAADATLKTATDAAAGAVAAIKDLSPMSNGAYCLSVSADQTVQLWSPVTMQPLDAFNLLPQPVVDASSLSGQQFVTGAGKSLAVWSLTPDWKLTTTLGPPADEPLNISGSPFSSRVLSIDISPDGKLLVAGGGDPSRTGELIIYNLETGEILQNIENAHSDTVLTVKFSRDGQYILSGAADKFVKIHKVADGSFVRSFEGHTHHVLGVDWKADGSIIASSSADNSVKVWNVETGEQIRTISGFGKQVTGLEFIGTTGNIVDSAGDKTVRLHNTADGKGLKTYAGGTDFMYTVDTTRDGKLVVSGGQDGTLRVWNGEDAKSVMTVAPREK
ncbi:c-type cytochrome domain-containing protein [Polystyrenella longa]|nr:c-type cytochrome domain-containing protein [Polystyrenella longa]